MSDNTAPQCRFCLDTEIDLFNPMIAPCACRGSVRYVHVQCLQRWAAIGPPDMIQTCTLCREPYQILLDPRLPVVAPAFEEGPGVVAPLCTTYLEHATALSTLLFYTILLANAYGSKEDIEYIMFESAVNASIVAHILFFYCVVRAWRVPGPVREVYVRFLRESYMAPLLLLHAFLFVSFAVQRSILTGFAINYLYSSYWRQHRNALERAEREVIERDE